VKRLITLSILLVVGTGAIGVALGSVSQEPGPVTIQTMDVRENLYVISGGGGHTAALVTDGHGVVLVDTKLAGWGRPILEALQAITSEPVTVIINTHSHGDHVGGNTDFPSQVEIIAQVNTAAKMERMETFMGDGEEFLPDRTFDDRLTLFDGRDQIDLYHFGSGHTDGDVIVVFPALGVAHMGDLFAVRGTPIIDVLNGGSGVAYPRTLERAVEAISGVRRVIPGHIVPPAGSPIPRWATWDDVVEYAQFNRDFLDAVKIAKEAGQSIEAAVAGLDFETRYPEYDMNRAGRNVQVIYDELGL
jgi:cyclase